MSLNPQLVGNIIARVLRISKSNENSKGFLPTSHINMILGEPAGNINKDDFYGFFHRLNLFANLEGTTIVPSCTSMLPMLPVDRATLEWKRSFFLAYFPMNFWNDFSTVFLTSFTPEKDIEYSFTTAASNVINPVTLQSGAKLFVWKHNILLLLSDKSVFYVLLDSSSCNSKDGYFYRHIDVWMCGSLEIQAQLMSTACDTFQSVSDYVMYIHNTYVYTEFKITDGPIFEQVFCHLENYVSHFGTTCQISQNSNVVLYAKCVT